MLKKLLFICIFIFIFTLQFNIKIEALQISDLQTFSGLFNPVRSFENDPEDPNGPPLKEGDFAMLVSPCFVLPDNFTTLTVQATNNMVSNFGLVYKSTDNFFTEIRYFENDDCTNQLFGNITDVNSKFITNNPDGLLASKGYVFDLDVPFKGFDINNPIGIRAFQMVYATNIPHQNIIPFYFTSGTTPSTALTNIRAFTRFSYEIPRRVDFLIEGTVISKFFLDRFPIFPVPTKPLHNFLHFVDIDGKRAGASGAFVSAFSLITTLQERNIILTAVFEKNFVTGQPITVYTPPDITNPIGVILFNTGYYNITGFVFLYTLLILGSSILLFRYNMPTFVTLISNIAITAVFMFFGYLPFFVAMIMILLFILLIIGINKGGLFSE